MNASNVSEVLSVTVNISRAIYAESSALINLIVTPCIFLQNRFSSLTKE